MRCPRCSAELADKSVGAGAHVHECPRCEGLWLGVAEFRRVLTEVELQQALSRARLREPAPARADSDAEIRCPRCAAIMACVQFGVRSGVFVDVCRPDGVWFDRAELHAVARFILDGGLDERRPRPAAAFREDAAVHGEAVALLAHYAPADVSPTPQEREGARIARLGKMFELIIDLIRPGL
jgi:Zn-finger nucleic acid-binding protein